MLLSSGQGTDQALQAGQSGLYIHVGPSDILGNAKQRGPGKREPEILWEGLAPPR